MELYLDKSSEVTTVERAAIHWEDAQPSTQPTSSRHRPKHITNIFPVVAFPTIGSYIISPKRRGIILFFLLIDTVYRVNFVSSSRQFLPFLYLKLNSTRYYQPSNFPAFGLTVTVTVTGRLLCFKVALFCSHRIDWIC
jgi:hypothetical protein